MFVTFPKQAPAGADRRRTMKIIEIKVDEALWSNSMLPEGTVAKWLVVAVNDVIEPGSLLATLAPV